MSGQTLWTLISALADPEFELGFREGHPDQRDETFGESSSATLHLVGWLVGWLMFILWIEDEQE